MALCAFVGDALTALGFRLAGIECYCPTAAETPALFRDLRERVQLIVLTAESAAALPPGLLRKAEAAERPLVLVIADVCGRVHPADRADLVRRQLGIAE